MSAPTAEEFFDWVEGSVRGRFARGDVGKETPMMCAFGSKAEMQPLEPPLTEKYLYTRDNAPRTMVIDIEENGTTRRLGKTRRGWGTDVTKH